MASPLPPAPTPPSANMMGGGDRTTDLLNLLKFSGQGQVPQRPPSDQDSDVSGSSSDGADEESRDALGESAASLPRILQPAPTAADPSGLLAKLMRGHHESDEPHPEPPKPAPTASSFTSTETPEKSRQALLDLLNRPKPSQTDSPMFNNTEARRAENMSPGNVGRNYPPNVPNFSGGPAFPPIGHPLPQNFPPPTSFDQPTPYSFHQNHNETTGPAPWVYGKQFDTGSQSFSQHQSPGVSSQPDPMAHAQSPPPPPSQPPFHILKKPQSASSTSQAAVDFQRHDSHHGSHHGSFQDSDRNVSSPQYRRLYEQGSAPVGNTQSPDSGHLFYPGISHQEDKHKETVAEALSGLASQANKEAREAIARAEQDQRDRGIDDDIKEMLKAETEKNFRQASHPSQGIQQDLTRDENPLPPRVAQRVRHIADDPAQGVAESWENEPEETRPPIKVYNFPMKPWISIHMKDAPDVPRPEFSEDNFTLRNVAALKKDFDQIDRNLCTATQNYIAYGLSRGGFRVIRQEEGREAKIFTETKDRIFNISMSVTTPEHSGVHREAIIGTGVSGTVYWLQIKDGDKDHIEDIHPEQYGFALPPITSQDGDTPGGVLKTRARPSSIHPEFFAVGRGKSINIIWPAYIMTQNIFKQGHDRVVDTETLAKQCSLKINTGKAGKDFTFSQDDSLIVSLDKSGRVKFWDVRDLTAIKDGSDPRFPMPAHTAVEVNTPLMTLNSTPEGEKAWPTSVLLLDKLRPYQRRCALRYMIVGMKQNHTLQLWDLALGKPVQEFHLPHSKESDPVCSVMYHASTGMLVIGHPTRNSIYLAHLSAPKYNLKSISQVEYTQRLATQDASIPSPDSTAVISGVREYSFANRGVLRSLDMLATPSMLQDPEEPTLFELYSMYSKGVACIMIKQRELGWSKENKVLDAVDAVEAGVAVIDKIKNPAPLPPGENIHPHSGNANASSTEPAPTPISRQLAKESLLQTTPSSQDEGPSHRDPEFPSSGHMVEFKDEDTAARVNQSSADKNDKKSRKKKAALADPISNGNNNNSPLARASNSKQEMNRASRDTPTASTTSPSLNQEHLDLVAGMESRLGSSLAGVLDKSLKAMLGKFDDLMRNRDSDFHGGQVKLLESVSSTLSENTQKVLEDIIQQQFSEMVVPAVSRVAGKAVSDQLESHLTAQIGRTMQNEIHKALPMATQHALHSADFIVAVSDRVSNAVGGTVQSELLTNLVNRLNPAISTIASQASQRVAAEMQQHYQDELARLHAQRQKDAGKIDNLVTLVNHLNETVSKMAATQMQNQNELKFRQQLPSQAPPQRTSVQNYSPSLQSQLQSQIQGQLQSQVSDHMHSPPQANPIPGSLAGLVHGAPSQTGGLSQSTLSQAALSQVPSSHLQSHVPNQQTLTHLANQNSRSLGGQGQGQSVQQPDADTNALGQLIQSIQTNMQLIKYENAMMEWLQSGREKDIFDTYMYSVSPYFVQDLPPLMLLSIVATLSRQLDGNRTREKVNWLELVTHSLFPKLATMQDEKAREMTPRIMSLLAEQIEVLFVHINRTSPTDPLLKNLSQTISLAKHITEIVRAPQAGHYDAA